MDGDRTAKDGASVCAYSRNEARYGKGYLIFIEQKNVIGCL